MFDGLFQPMHLLVILVIALFVFGPKRISELGKGLGDSIRSFKGAIRDPEKVSEAGTPAVSTQVTNERAS
jgi:sec-independent protein translocase protein TatA